VIKDIRGPLRGFLLDDSAVATLVSTRIYPRVLPQGTRDPSLVYNRISVLGDHHMQGASGLVAVRMQIDAWADTADQAYDLAAAVKYRLDGYRGAMSSVDSPPQVVDVQGVFFQTARDDVDADRKLFRESWDYMLHYGER
jgi:hypothetical protein